ncbi:MFS transporter [Sulfuracidifex metallicus]|uniref:MFS transporter n=1 Tax=Sulfuracidifex metallicus DSM 6482 = JCM 9184 TaxID=523847 RepID=A0A6A9QFA9_SULME|nr:MFS transporter [Sulfuracidifex metallicus]MUN27907.1 MFS transporter [Sulfuracidifex metallicus DSM 6482 = JCM 9184]
MDYRKDVDFSGWNASHWSLFVSIMVGFFMWGVIASIAPLFYPSVNAVWFLVVPILAQLAGDLGISALSDFKLGRRGTFFLTMGLYGTGSMIIFASSTAASMSIISSSSPLFLILIVLGIVAADMGIEGEVPTALSYASETMPIKLREKMLVILPNFNNVGAMVAALVSYLTYSLSNSYILQLRVLGLLSLVLVGIALFLRRRTPESVRWLIKAGRNNEAKKEIERDFKPTSIVQEKHVNKRVSLAFRFAFLVVISVSQYLTYGLMASTIADYYFKGVTVDLIYLVANVGASLAGFIAAMISSRLGSRTFALFSFVGGTLTMLPILALVTSVIPFTLLAFYILLMANMFFSEFGWAVRTILEPTLMPIKARAFLIGSVRIAPMLSYAASLELTSTFTEVQFVLFNLILWSLGAFASVMWFFKGYDTNLVPIEETSQEVERQGQA